MTRLAEPATPREPAVNYAGYVLSRLIVITNDLPADANKLTISGHRALPDGTCEARIRLAGDAQDYRITVGVEGRGQ